MSWQHFVHFIQSKIAGLCLGTFLCMKDIIWKVTNLLSRQLRVLSPIISMCCACSYSFDNKKKCWFKSCEPFFTSPKDSAKVRKWKGFYGHKTMLGRSRRRLFVITEFVPGIGMHVVPIAAAVSSLLQCGYNKRFTINFSHLSKCTAVCLSYFSSLFTKTKETQNCFQPGEPGMCKHSVNGIQSFWRVYATKLLGKTRGQFIPNVAF